MLIKVVELNSGLGTPSACNFIATGWRSPSFLDTNLLTQTPTTSAAYNGYRCRGTGGKNFL